MKFTRLLAVLVLVSAATTPGIATANEAPLPDAGLDQSVTRGTTVHLDAGGSRDPDGTVTDYEWRIEAPNGSTTPPNCVDCERARFQATSVGEYTVTLTVTDDDGATATDTLYVQVEPGAPPSVSLAGPSQLSTAEQGTYTATVSAGAAPLDRLVWYTDGERRATSDVDGTAASVDQQLQFPETGGHDVRVVAIDEDDQRSEATRTVDVAAVGGVDPTGSSENETTSDAPTPDVEGPRVVTGDTVLDATYRLTNATATADWFLDDRHVDVGDTATLTLSPGTHELYAAPDSGGVSTFPDGTRTVLADPAPDVSLQRATEESVVTVDAYATDDLGNLQSLEVLVDGEVKRTTSLGGIERRSTGGDRLTTVERLTDVAPGNRNITVRATDSRGQTDSVSRTIHVPGPPRVVNARFVNDEPLMSKHPKLDPEDYTGQFEVDVALNGVDPEQVRATFLPHDQRVSASPTRDRVTTDGYGLTIRHNASRVLAGSIRAEGVVYWERGNERVGIDRVSGETYSELSEPIIRLDLIDAQNRIGERGATFDASGTFDPDGTDITFTWTDASSGTEWNGPTKQLHPRKLIYLNVSDRQDQHNGTLRILDWFTPTLQPPEPQNSKPVFPQNTVTYRIRTTKYELSKSVYEKEEMGKVIDFELVSEVGRVGGHGRYAQDPNSGNFDQGLPGDFNEAFVFHEWFVAVPASEFLAGDQPTVRIQSTRQSEAYREVELPDPRMYRQIGSSMELMRFDVSYVEQYPDYDVQRTTSVERKESLQRMGFDLHTARQSGTEYYLEKRVKVEPAQWKTVTRDFDSEFRRRTFLNANPGWSSDGSSEQRRERTVTETDWRDDKDGKGEFTGDTQRVQVEPAEVETILEYEYEKTVEVDVTEEVERKHCVPLGGCTITEVEVEKTEERTKTVDYWSEQPRNPAHDRTGNTKTRTVDHAEYKTQYEFRVEDIEMYWKTVYQASTRELSQPAEYAWQPHETVTSERAAAILTSNSAIREASTEPTREWTLRRRDGSYNRTVDTPEQRSHVVETEMTARVEVEGRFLPPNPTVRSDIVTEDRIVDVTETQSNFVPIEEAKNIVREKANKTHASAF